MYKLVALDMDGTLLDSNKQISKANKDAIRRFEDMGGYVILCSGRSAFAMKKYIKELGLKSKYHISMMGAQIFSDEKKYPPSYELTQEQYERIVKRLKELDVVSVIYAGDKVYYEKSVDALDYEFSISQDPDSLVHGSIEGHEHVFKATAYTEDPEIHKKLGELQVPGVNIYQMYGVYTDYFPAQANKFAGIMTVADYLGVDSKDVMAMGDGDIDRDMVQGAGFGIAVANSSEELKGYANRICDYSNDQDAVARAIYKFIFKEPFPGDADAKKA